MKGFALALISGYRRYVSPRKGFCCAYSVHTGGATCSALGYRAIRMKGVVSGIAILRERLFLCGLAHRRFGPKHVRRQVRQRGDCDVGSFDSPCDGDGAGDCGGGRGRSFNCLDGLTCDWPSSDKKEKRRKRKSGSEIHLPPQKA